MGEETTLEHATPATGPVRGSMLRAILARMAEVGASDVFVTGGAQIHFKVNGQAVPVGKQVMLPPVIRDMAYAELNERQIRQFENSPDLNLSIVLPDHGNFRISLFRQRGSIALVARYITFGIPTIVQLGLPPVLNELIMHKRGLILVVGSTGAGKSTTLAAMIDHRATHHPGHILTLEDPIEYLFTHKKSIINQRDIGVDSASYHEALRAALRQAPDCLLIGEIRDASTMQSAIGFSLSGHLCLATLHANNSYHALSRIVNMFPADSRQTLVQDLSASLKCVIAQRLVIDEQGKRVAVVELLNNTPQIRGMIEKGELNEIKEAMENSLTGELLNFDRALVQLYRAGRISRETAVENADSFTNITLLLDGDGPQRAASSQDEAGPFGGLKLNFGA